MGNFIGLPANQRSNHLVELAVKQAEAMVPELPVVGLKVYLGLEGWLPVLHRSDHSPFWKAKIPAMLWADTAEFRNPHYHRATDTPETLDYVRSASTSCSWSAVGYVRRNSNLTRR